MKEASLSIFLIISLVFITWVFWPVCSTSQSLPGFNDTQAIKNIPTRLLPNFSMIDAKGNEVNLELLLGKKVFVNIWATWCLPCRAELKTIERLKQRTDSNRVTFIMLSIDDDMQKALRFINRKYPSLAMYYPNENLPSLFRVPAIPATFIFSEKGVLQMAFLGKQKFDTKEFIGLLQ